MKDPAEPGVCAQARLRIMRGDDIAMGPGKADLLQAIADSGSISAAARALGMSYRRAWQLVETMNACFDPPLVRPSKGGRGGGGAELTPQGQAVLAAYRKLQGEVQAVLESALPALAVGIREVPRRARRPR
ncbi:MAG: LysR family transcriptional regulator [Nevskia sp.]|nr:LysR family transcriptional regulator [Nevskia sp.]